MASKLTEKEEKFVQGVISGMTQRAAYKNAYDTKRMSDSVIDSQASAMLHGTGKYRKNPKVAKRYRELNAAVEAEAEKIRKEGEDAAIANALEIRTFLTQVMRREVCECVVVTLMEEKSEWVQNPDTGKLIKQTTKKEVPQVVEIPARLTDAIKSAELMGRSVGMFNKFDLNLNGEVKVEPVQFYMPDNKRDDKLTKPSDENIKDK